DLAAQEVHVGAPIPGLGEVGCQLHDLVEKLQGKILVLVRNRLHRALHQQVDGGTPGVQPDPLDGFCNRLSAIFVVGGGQQGVEVGKGPLPLLGGLGQGGGTVLALRRGRRHGRRRAILVARGRVILRGRMLGYRRRLLRRALGQRAGAATDEEENRGHDGKGGGGKARARQLHVGSIPVRRRRRQSWPWISPGGL